jgi:uncharacterized protein YjeT (DUF2065 family)
MPGRMQQMMRLALEMDPASLRRAGLIAMAIGFGLAWLIRAA